MIVNEKKSAVDITLAKDLRPSAVFTFQREPQGEVFLGFTDFCKRVVAFVDYEIVSNSKYRVNGYSPESKVKLYNVRYIDWIDSINVRYMDE